MNEERFQLLTEKYLEGGLSDDEARELLEAPEPARARLFDEVALAGLLERVHTGAPVDLAARVQAALRTSAQKEAMVAVVMSRIGGSGRRRFAWGVLVALAAGALVAISLVAVRAPRGAVPPPPPREGTFPKSAPFAMTEDARRAVARGVEYLRRATFPPSTHQAPMPPDELVLLAFLHAGVPPGDARVQKLLGQVLAARPQRTYCVSLRALMLAKLDPVGYQGRIAECAQFLVDNQCINGQWSYGTPTLPASGIVVKKTRDGPLSGNNSCSAFAALGLRACVEAGIGIPPETFERAIRAWHESLRMDTDGRGGWCYTREESPHRPYGSMSAAGLAALATLSRLAGQDWRQDKAAQVAQDWVRYHFTPLENYGPVEELMAKEMISDTPNSNTELYYYLWAVERAAAVCGMEKFGDRDWYADGVHELLAAQRPDGSWWSGVKRCQPVYDTCFAILFLTRSTRPIGD
ncbi:MAG TPA: prenyltransferase/squalene oxidase repeat-containing protein [Planctomycetota bacterium]|nr:prenyltransferase/squalene oxidase repeat-containing protein [Planctomycetota bacterium]